MLYSAGIADGSSVNQVLLQFSTSVESLPLQEITDRLLDILKQIPPVPHHDQ